MVRSKPPGEAHKISLVTVYLDGSLLESNSGFTNPEKRKVRPDRVKKIFFISF
jgi:hypothetical protein